MGKPPPLAAALRAAADKVGGSKPDSLSDDRRAKKNYAQALSNALALLFADHLRHRFPRARVTPSADGTQQEFALGRGLDRKKTDVGVWDDAAGLVLGLSIKTYSFRDPKGAVVNGLYPTAARYVKNAKRNDMELRDQADVLHRRQRYAVLAAIMFLPEDASWDGVNGQSSFAHHVFTLRKRAGRAGPDEPRTDLFEKVYVALYGDDGSVGFFDVTEPPPRNQPPRRMLTLEALIDDLDGEVTFRNTGLRRDEDMYAPDDATWSPPPDWSMPRGLDAEPPVTLDDAFDDDTRAPDDEE